MPAKFSFTVFLCEILENFIAKCYSMTCLCYYSHHCRFYHYSLIDFFSLPKIYILSNQRLFLLWTVLVLNICTHTYIYIYIYIYIDTHIERAIFEEISNSNLGSLKNTSSVFIFISLLALYSTRPN